MFTILCVYVSCFAFISFVIWYDSFTQILCKKFCLIYSVLCIKKIQQDTTVCRYLFTAKSLYIFRLSVAPIIGSA